MKDCETARQGAQNLTTHTSVKTPSSIERALQEVGEDQDDAATERVAPANWKIFRPIKKNTNGSLINRSQGRL